VQQLNRVRRQKRAMMIATLGARQLQLQHHSGRKPIHQEHVDFSSHNWTDEALKISE